MAQDARSRVETTPKGRRSPIIRQRGSCGSWRPSGTGSRTSPKPPFQNPSIAGSACVPTLWDRGSWRAAEGQAGRLATHPPRFRGKSRDTGMLVWTPRPPLANPATSALGTIPQPSFRGKSRDTDMLVWAPVQQMYSGAPRTLLKSRPMAHPGSYVRVETRRRRAVGSRTDPLDWPLLFLEIGPSNSVDDKPVPNRRGRLALPNRPTLLCR